MTTPESPRSDKPSNATSRVRRWGTIATTLSLVPIIGCIGYWSIQSYAVATGGQPFPINLATGGSRGLDAPSDFRPQPDELCVLMVRRQAPDGREFADLNASLELYHHPKLFRVVDLVAFDNEGLPQVYPDEGYRGQDETTPVEYRSNSLLCIPQSKEESTRRQPNTQPRRTLFKGDPLFPQQKAAYAAHQVRRAA